MKMSRKDIEKDDFKGMTYEQFKCPIFTVYHNPSDYPGMYVARLFNFEKPTPYITTASTLTDLRRKLPGFMSKLDRCPSDDIAIVEIWL